MNVLLKKSGKVVACIGALALWVSSSVYAAPLKTAAQDSSPKYYKEGDSMQGICIDILKAVEKVDPSIEFTGQDAFLPFKRLQKKLREGKLDVFFGLKNSKKRVGKYVFSPTPLYTINYVLAVNAEDVDLISSFDDIKKMGADGKVLSVSGSAATRFLQKVEGLIVEDRAKSPAMLLKMLSAKRARFAFYHDMGLKDIIKREGLQDKIKVLPISFSQYSHSLAFSNATSAEVVAKVQKALDTLVKNGELKKIQKKYGL